MGLIDNLIYIAIALVYNLFVHNLASISYKDLQYEEKHKNTIIMLVLFGAMAIIISKFIKEKNTKYANEYVSKGLLYGGILLLLTAIYANWEYMTEEIKLLLIVLIFGYLIWYGYKRENNINKKKMEDAKINKEIIDEILNEKNNKSLN